ncbi:prolyl oligopeptidase family serine peptidase [Solitalea lacus]|uniref:carboxylesterase family protein n=1 Tax=Solitalea lacus TaxID=2911172 RepID=UPI001EDB7899|nr:prolyl oligopeptidase family serine peptidase [Solitalea lacus]UKJ08959.1 prolyl oligopeptidase family serine peptidase [Solitalea lacus]
MTRKNLLLSILNLALFIFPSIPLQAQNLDLFLKKEFILKNDTLKYRILLPENFDAAKKYPLILFLHGAGERGSDNEKQLVHGSKLFLSDSIRKQFPAIVIFPQCPENQFWSNVKIKITPDHREFTFQANGEPTTPLALVQKFMKNFIAQGNVDNKRIYIMGLSMGGMGTFELLWRNPKLFAAAIPICGGAHPATVKQYAKHTAVWIFHGADDPVVPVDFSRQMFEALKQAKAEAKYTEYPGIGHNSWDNTFAEPQLLSWLFTQSHK